MLTVKLQYCLSVTLSTINLKWTGVGLTRSLGCERPARLTYQLAQSASHTECIEIRPPLLVLQLYSFPCSVLPCIPLHYRGHAVDSRVRVM